ncbi:DinB family protein [Adhaeribacter aquaticus]|uniref:DinB family protein n=1 Tax=Adhaeribacter aquaticus TaxID=299567 RepID=UPI00047A10BE|nr:DinB family protein [Adhaeribacter aquaticus]
MQFSLSKSLEVLERTPQVLFSMLNNLSSQWIEANEGENTWTPKEIVAHLIICEKTNWLTRAKIILSDSTDKILSPIDMMGHFDLAKNSSLQDLLKGFSRLRECSLDELKKLSSDESSLQKTAMHPKVGEVSLQQLIATWVTHDLSHITQISRVMARQQKEQVGPFEVFLKILNA